MVASFVAGAVLAVAGVAYLGYKYHSAKAVLAAVEAELVKLENEAKSYNVALTQDAAAELKKVEPYLLKQISRLKALL